MENIFKEGDIRGLLDMRWGHPLYMKECYDNSNFCTLSLNSNLQYPKVNDPITIDLEASLRQTHKKYKNAITDNKEFVLGNGAMQILLAIMYAIQAKENKPINIYAEKPYWARFKVLAQLANHELHWCDKHPGYKNSLEIITVPNNPDNNDTPCLYRSQYRITDLCYNWPQYTDQVQYDEDIMVFGLAKMTGHAGSRIGWAWIKDKEIAELVQGYIEVTTSGVSLDSQQKAIAVLDDINEDTFKTAKKVLTYRWKRFKKEADQLTDEFTTLNNSGMFIWCKVKDGDGPRTFKRCSKSLGVSGEGFGMDRSYVRLNLGCEKERFDQFIDNLKKYLTSK